MPLTNTTDTLPPLMPTEILESIPVLEEGLPAEALEPAGLSPWLLWGGLLGTLLLAAGLLYYIIRAKRRPAPKTTPEETALKKLDELRTAQPDTRACSLALSLILREYLCGKTQDPALYETHEEFRQRLDALSTIPRDCQYNVRKILEKLAELKYAGIQANEAELNATLITETEETILQIHEAQQLEEAAAKELAKVKKLS